MRQLRSRYEDKFVILEYYIKRFMHPARASEDACSLRRLIDQVKGAGDSLAARGYTRAKIFDAVAMYQIKTHLPQPSHNVWGHQGRAGQFPTGPVSLHRVPRITLASLHISYLM